jgi:tight adherence protein C
MSPFPQELDVLSIVAVSGAVLLLLLSVCGYYLNAGRERLDARIARVQPQAGRNGGLAGNNADPGPFRRLGDLVAGTILIGKAEQAKIRAGLYAAGFDKPGATAYFIGLKVCLLLLGIGLSTLWAQTRPDRPMMLMTIGSVLSAGLSGWRGPDIVLSRLRRRRREAIEQGLPDVLDLLVICGESGLGLETAVERVAREIRHAHPALGKELSITSTEMRLLPDRFSALSNMAERLELDSVRGIVSTLMQTMRFGTPLGQALRVLANEMRTTRQHRFEERAARLPVLITLPMILFILPCVFIIVAGPAILDVLKTFHRI